VLGKLLKMHDLVEDRLDKVSTKATRSSGAIKNIWLNWQGSVENYCQESIVAL
jgi:hypothetical protein